MKKILIVLFCLTSVSAFAQVVPLPGSSLTYWIKPHTANLVTSQIDDINHKQLALFAGANRTALAVVDTVFNNVSTAIDTSKAYLIPNGAWTIRYDVVETSGTADVTIKVYTAPNLQEFGYEETSLTPPPIGRFTLFSSLTITPEAKGNWKIDSIIVPAHNWYYLTITGIGSNEIGRAHV